MPIRPFGPTILLLICLSSTALGSSKYALEINNANHSAAGSFIETEENSTDDIGFANPGRYQVYEDTVFDNQTGLEWQRSANYFVPDLSYEERCGTLELGGKWDWRVPNFLELHSIMKYTKPLLPGPNFFIDGDVFPNTYHSAYATSDFDVLDGTENRVIIDFALGTILTTANDLPYASLSNPPKLRCVRAGRGTLLPSFQVNDNGTITDKTRGLIWQVSISEDNHVSNQAEVYCDSLALGGLSHWRVPSIHEISTLLNFRNSSISKHYVNIFPNSQHLWLSSQVNKKNTVEYFQVNFKPLGPAYEYVTSVDDSGPFHFVRCVHSGI